MSILKTIKILCVNKGITLSALEKSLGLGNGSISKWDKATPSGDRLAKVADYFNVTIDYLLGRENSPQTAELEGAFFRLKKGLEPLGLSNEDAEFLLAVYKAHKERNK